VYFLNSFNLFWKVSLLSFSICEVPNPSTQNDAITVPWTTASFKESKSNFLFWDKNPANPPAKVSPAPVGSLTFLTGYAGVVKKLLFIKQHRSVLSFFNNNVLWSHFQYFLCSIKKSVFSGKL